MANVELAVVASLTLSLFLTGIFVSSPKVGGIHDNNLVQRRPVALAHAKPLKEARQVQDGSTSRSTRGVR